MSCPGVQRVAGISYETQKKIKGQTDHLEDSAESSIEP